MMLILVSLEKPDYLVKIGHFSLMARVGWAGAEREMSSEEGHALSSCVQELSAVMEMLCGCAVQFGRQPCVVTEHVKCS